jgi:Coenzyme PQQ synthesis protein D (PqqD)
VRNGDSYFVPQRRNGIVREVADDFIIYQAETHTAHCLNSTAAQVWKLCDGKKTVAQITRTLQKNLPSPVDEELVWMALRKLWKSGLLEKQGQAEVSLSRRAFVGKMKVAASVLAVPVVSSILVPTAEAAGSPCRHTLAACPQGNSQCCSGVCVAGLCVGG